MFIGLKKQKRKNKVASFVLGLMLLLVALLSGMETVSAASDSLKVTAGYFGGPYYEKRVYSLSEMQSMSGNYAYSMIDASGSVCYVFATGPRVESVLSQAGVSIGDVRTLYFRTSDSGSSYYTSFSPSELLSSRRYYYPNLGYNFENGMITDRKKAAKGAKSVPAILSVTNKWIEYDPEDGDVKESWSGQSAESRYRLLLGQASIEERSVNKSARWVHEIQVLYSGSPGLEITGTGDSYKVGGTYKLDLSIDAAEENIIEDIRKDVEWSSDNEDIATVDENGNVTIKKKGNVKITATYKMKNETVTAEATLGTGTGSEGDGSGSGTDGESKGDGSGEGESGGTGGSVTMDNGNVAKAISMSEISAKDAKSIKGKLNAKNDKASKSGEKGKKSDMKVYEITQKDLLPKQETEPKESPFGGVAAGAVGVTILLLSIAGRAEFFFKQI